MKHVAHPKHHAIIQLLALTIASVFICSCSRSKPQLVEAQPPYQPPPPPVVQIPTVVPAKLGEVEEAVQRVFKGAALLDTKLKPNYIAGDFNGDLVQDVAVVIKAVSGKIDQMNEQYPAWMLRDPLARENIRSSDLKVDEDESLLAIIHGYGPNDWRDPQATQTFLLKNVVGVNMQVHPGKKVIAANKGQRLPSISGDVIEQVLGGKRGYLYFGMATYRWFDPSSFKGEPQVGPFHRAMARK